MIEMSEFNELGLTVAFAMTAKNIAALRILIIMTTFALSNCILVYLSQCPFVSISSIIKLLWVIFLYPSSNITNPAPEEHPSPKGIRSPFIRDEESLELYDRDLIGMRIIG